MNNEKFNDLKNEAKIKLYNTISNLCFDWNMGNKEAIAKDDLKRILEESFEWCIERFLD